MIMRGAALVALVLLFLGCAQAARTSSSSLDLGSEAHSADFANMLAAAENGDAKAQLLIGLSYFFGEYRDGSKVEQSYEQAQKWLRRSAAAGNSYAQWHLGGMYLQGKGVALDPGEAAHWYMASAKQGNVSARNNLAIQFLEGTGVPQDYEKAFAWASLAAFCGNKSAGSIAQEALAHLPDRTRAEALAAEYFKSYGTADPYGESCERAVSPK